MIEVNLKLTGIKGRTVFPAPFIFEEEEFKSMGTTTIVDYLKTVKDNLDSFVISISDPWRDKHCRFTLKGVDPAEISFCIKKSISYIYE